MAFIREIYKYLKYFTPNEKNYAGKPNAFGDFNKMNGLLLRLLDEWRAEVGKPCIIHCGYELSGHASQSYHAIGDAVDCHFSGCSLWAAYSALQKVLGRYNLQNRVGIGVYFNWVNPGFHFDLRGFELTWYCEKANSYVYDKAGTIAKMKAKAGIK